jgi:hypothetical protein
VKRNYGDEMEIFQKYRKSKMPRVGKAEKMKKAKSILERFTNLDEQIIWCL